MQLPPSLLLCLSLGLATGSAAAQDAANHEAHHPASASADKPKSKAAAPMNKMDEQMKAMHEMHQKMMAAKTPEERKALMAEHMKTMQESMSMMTGMMGTGAEGEKKMSAQAMKKQMDMTTMMMQMMMDEMETPEHAHPK